MRFPHLAAALIAATAFGGAAAATPITITLDDDNQRYNIPPGQALLVRQIEWLEEPEATHEIVHFSPSGFGSSIQIFKPEDSDVWTPSLSPEGFFIAADSAMPPALVMSLTNTRVDWRDVRITGELIAVDDAAAWAAALGDPSLAHGARAFTVTLNDASPAYTVPNDAWFSTRNIFYHLDSGATTRRVQFVNSADGIISVDLGVQQAAGWVNLDIEPENDRVGRFQTTLALGGYDTLTLEDGTPADFIDVTISGFLLDAGEGEENDTTATDCQIPLELVGDWTLVDVDITNNGMSGPPLSTISGALLSMQCDRSYVDDATGATVAPAANLPPLPGGLGYASCTFLAGGSTGTVRLESGGLRFTPSAVTGDQTDCTYAVNQFGVHVHESPGPWSYETAGANLTLSRQQGPFTLSLVYER